MRFLVVEGTGFVSSLVVGILRAGGGVLGLVGC
jgi:hypothetical protein